MVEIENNERKLKSREKKRWANSSMLVGSIRLGILSWPLLASLGFRIIRIQLTHFVAWLRSTRSEVEESGRLKGEETEKEEDGKKKERPRPSKKGQEVRTPAQT